MLYLNQIATGELDMRFCSSRPYTHTVEYSNFQKKIQVPPRIRESRHNESEHTN